MKIPAQLLRNSLVKIKNVVNPETINLRSTNGKLFIEAANPPYALLATLPFEDKEFSLCVDFNMLFKAVKATGEFHFDVITTSKENKLACKQGRASFEFAIENARPFHIDLTETKKYKGKHARDIFSLNQYYTVKDLKFNKDEATVNLEADGKQLTVSAANYAQAVIVNAKSKLEMQAKVKPDNLAKIEKLVGKENYELGVNENFIYVKCVESNTEHHLAVSLHDTNPISLQEITVLKDRELKGYKAAFALEVDKALEFLDSASTIVTDNTVIEINVGKTVSFEVRTPKGKVNQEVSSSKVALKSLVEVDLLFFSDLMKKLSGHKVKVFVCKRSLVFVVQKEVSLTYVLGIL